MRTWQWAVVLAVLGAAIGPAAAILDQPAAGAAFLSSPGGGQVAWTRLEYTAQGAPQTQAWVCRADGSGPRQVGAIPGDRPDVVWVGEDRLALTAPEDNRYAVFTLADGAMRELSLPAGFQGVYYKRLSPDGRLVAFIGQRVNDAYGLWLADLGKGTARLLLGKILRTAPAWSPDGKWLAFGHAEGYTAFYPLALLEVASGTVKVLDVQGVGCAWSPDSRYVACTSHVIRGGSWRNGVPTDGGLAVYDTVTKELRPLGPAGERDEKGSGGSLNPVWSPDGGRIAFQRARTVGEDDQAELWVAEVATGQARKVADRWLPAGWGADGEALFALDRQEIRRIPLAGGEPTVLASWPRPAPPAVQVRAPIEVTVDPRVELMSLVFRLAGSREYTMGRVPSYTDDADRQFGRFRGQGAVETAVGLRASRGVSYDAVMSMAVHLADADAVELQVPLSPWPANLDKRWPADKTVDFLGQVRQLARDGDFQGFVRAHQPLYQAAVAGASAVLARDGHLEWFGRFFGARPQARFHVCLGMLNGPCCYGGRLARGGQEDLYCILGVWQCDSNGYPTFDAGIMPTVVHEFCHSYTNPVADRHMAKLAAAGKKVWPELRAAMGEQAYGSWQTMVTETLVRACVLRYVLATQGQAAYDAGKWGEKQRQFIWVPGIADLLAQYEAHRDRYPTLDRFYPKIVSYINRQAGVRAPAS